MANKTFNTRVKNKRDTAANWEAVATTFQPLDGELIIVDTAAGKTRFKVGRYDSSKGRLLYYNEIPFTDEYLYNDLNESQGKIYDKLKGIDDKSIIEMTLEPVAGADDKIYAYNIGLWQFPKTGFYKIKLAKIGAKGVLLKLYARITKDDGTTPDDWDNNNLKAMGNADGDGLIEEIFAQVDYVNDDKFTVYRVQFFNVFGYLGSFWVNTYDKTTQKWAYDYAHRVTARDVSNYLTLTKGDTTTKFNGSSAQTVSIPTKTSELTNDSDFTTQTDLDNLTNTVVSYSAQENITDEQKAQARTNIGAISSSDLVQADWSETNTAYPSYIKNRPTIDAVLSDSSTNPVQNKVIATEIQAINNQLGGLTGAMHFIGKAAVDITDGSTTDPQIANYTTKEKGDVILGKDDHKEFVWNGAIWEELGDEGSYALKTTTINGKALSDNITLTARDVGAASASAIETMQAAIDSKPSAADAVYTATAESTDGVAYTATVSGIDSLTIGASFIMIPNKASTSKAPTLNVNGLGAKLIRRRLSSLTTSLQQGYSTNWIALNKPFTVVYDGTAWVIEGLTKTDGADVYGAVTRATADAKGNNIADTYATIAMLKSLLPKFTTITLTSNWVGDASPYYQDIALSCVTETSIFDLQPTPEQLNYWQDAGLAFTTLSGNGTVRVYVAGGKPSNAISVRVRVQEVTVI